MPHDTLEAALMDAVDPTDWAAIIDYSVPPVFDTKLRTPGGEIAERITTGATDFPAVAWPTMSESDSRDLFWAIGHLHRALVMVARLRPELRTEAERRVSLLDRSDPRGLGLLIERVIEDVRRELGSLKE